MIKESIVESVFRDSMGLRKYETCLIVTDDTREDLARPFLEYGKKACKECKMVLVSGMKRHGQEPSREVAEIMNAHYFAGAIDEVRVYSVALAEDDIRELAGPLAVEPARKSIWAWAAVKGQLYAP